MNIKLKSDKTGASLFIDKKLKRFVLSHPLQRKPSSFSLYLFNFVVSAVIELVLLLLLHLNTIFKLNEAALKINYD